MPGLARTSKPSIVLLVVPPRSRSVLLVVGLLLLMLLRPCLLGLWLRLRIAAGRLVALLHLLPLLHLLALLHGVALLHLLLHRLALLGFLLLHLLPLLPLLHGIGWLPLLLHPLTLLQDVLLLRLLSLLQLLLLRGLSLLHLLLLHVLALLHGVVALGSFGVVLARLLRLGRFDAGHVRQRAGRGLPTHAIRFGAGDDAQSGAWLVVLAACCGRLRIRPGKTCGGQLTRSHRGRLIVTAGHRAGRGRGRIAPRPGVGLRGREVLWTRGVCASRAVVLAIEQPHIVCRGCHARRTGDIRRSTAEARCRWRARHYLALESAGWQRTRRIGARRCKTRTHGGEAADAARHHRCL